jgi:hypothetical protein
VGKGNGFYFYEGDFIYYPMPGGVSEEGGE